MQNPASHATPCARYVVVRASTPRGVGKVIMSTRDRAWRDKWLSNELHNGKRSGWLRAETHK